MMFRSSYRYLRKYDTVFAYWKLKTVFILLIYRHFFVFIFCFLEY